MEAEDFPWQSNCFNTSLHTIREEFNLNRNLSYIKILISGLPATGKSVISNKLANFFNLPLLKEESVIKFWLDNYLKDFDK